MCHECTRGKGGAADFIVPMQFVEVAFVCCRLHSSEDLAGYNVGEHDMT